MFRGLPKIDNLPPSAVRAVRIMRCLETMMLLAFFLFLSFFTDPTGTIVLIVSILIAIRWLIGDWNDAANELKAASK